jgi:acetyl-CoA synthetase
MTMIPPSRDGALWHPDEAVKARANLTAAMAEIGFEAYEDFHAWSVADRDAFWGDAIERLGIVFDTGPGRIRDGAAAVEAEAWLPEARLNIAASCFGGDPDKPAILRRRDDGRVGVVTRADLRRMVLEMADGLVRSGLGVGDRVAIAMPMTPEAVAAYLGIIWAGGVVVSIADSFAAEEIATRLRITEVSVVVTQDVVYRGGRRLPMYAKVVEAGAQRAIVVATGADATLRDRDTSWSDFLGSAVDVDPVAAPADAPTNVLFSSGTTGDPKAIAWTHLTPVKAAADAYYHQDIHDDDVVAWPTNLGWMMGPWLIYGSLINGAAMALYDDVPTGAGFGEFVRDAGVTVLGVVPSLVAAWRASACMEDIDWSRIRLFSSTGEVSNAADMAYLMGLAGNKPVIEYCGGTEIGGSYITGTVLQPCVPSTFTTPALGIDLRVLDGAGQDATSGEVFLVPPSIGLSSRLINGDHHAVYFEGTPPADGAILRRHGDHMEKLPGGYYRALGRVDDTMNLGGIKVSSAEIERVVGSLDSVAESAAIAVAPPEGGPSQLVVFAVTRGAPDIEAEELRSAMQREVRAHLNPLFKIHEAVIVDALPRTASAKVMRRSLRDRYRDGGDG